MPRTPKVNLNNHRLLIWARESAGYAVEDIARAVGTSADAVLAWETGEKRPTYRQLEAFAKKVKRPVAALFLPEVPKDPPIPEDFRLLPGRRRGGFTPETLLAFRQLRNSMADLRELSDELGDPLRFVLPTWDLDDDAEEQAGCVRTTLGVTVEAQLQWQDAYEALHEWRRVLFQHGVLVQVFPTPLEDARGFSLLAHDLGGVGITSSDAPAARIFSLFHEVAHLCLGRPGVSTEFTDASSTSPSGLARLERYCNRFAAAFLLPGDHVSVRGDLTALADDLTRAEAQKYASRYAVSKYVVALRLGDLRLIGRERLQKEMETWYRLDAHDGERFKRPRRGADPLRARVSHAGKAYVATALEAVDRHILTAYEAGKMLAISPHSLDDVREMIV